MIERLTIPFTSFFSYKTERKLLLAAFLFTLLLFTAAVIILPISYETIDDFFMNSIASGYFGGTPDEHLIYTHFLIGLILKTLFNIWNTFNWYAAYLVGVLFVSFWVISWLLLKRAQTVIALSLALYLFLVFYIKFIIQLQFTTASGCLAIAGVLLLLEKMNSKEIKFNKQLILPIALLLFAGMIRHTSAFMVMILLAPLFLVLPLTIKNNLRSLGIYMVVFGLLGVSHFIDGRYYTLNSEWNEYMEHFKASSPYNDNRAYYSEFYSNPLKPYLKLGWSHNDVVLFTAYFRDFEPIYNRAAFNKIKSIVFSAPYNWKEFWNDLFYKFRFIHLYVLGAFTLLILPIRYWLKPFLVIASVIFIVWYINISLHLKERVLYVIYLGFSISLILMLVSNQYQPEIEPKRSIIKRYVFAAFILCILGFAVNAARNTFNQQNIALKSARKVFKQKMDFCDQNKFIIFWGASLNFENLNPFLNLFNSCSNPKVYSISAFAKSPLYSKQFKTLGADSFIGLFTKNNIEIVGNMDIDSTSKPERLELFFKEHLDMKLTTTYYEKLESIKFHKYSFMEADF
jgi:hypothetical protein